MPRFTPLLLTGWLAGGLATGPVAAQTVAPVLSQTAPEQGAVPRAHRFLDRFNAANTTRDGRLTLPQAQAGHMPWVTRNFAAIDAQQKGYVTVQDIGTYRRQMQAASSGPGSAQGAVPHAHRFLDRFNAADTDHDGRLTLSQVQAAHMPWVARNFAAIDVQQKGYVTLQDVRAYRRQLRAAPSNAAAISSQVAD